MASESEAENQAVMAAAVDGMITAARAVADQAGVTAMLILAYRNGGVACGIQAQGGSEEHAAVLLQAGPALIEQFAKDGENDRLHEVTGGN